ncbi:MAG: hypothetical protein ACP5O2_10640 [Bacteroidales bacterium]
MLDDLATAAYEALREKQYAQALELYRKALLEKPLQTAENYSRASFAANRCNEHNTSFKWAQKAYEIDPENPLVLQALAWAFYFYLNFLKDRASSDFIISWLTRLASKTIPETAKPFALAVIQAVPRLLDKEMPPFLSITRWLNQINPEILSNEPIIIQANEQNRMELASQRETLWALRTQVLYEAGWYTECIDMCNQALNQPIHWHYNNDIWINRRKALSCEALGQHKEAITIYEKLLSHREEWFIHYEYARLLKTQGDINKSQEHAARALLAEGQLSSKIHLIKFTAQTLQESGRSREAELHYLLWIGIYQEKGWRIPETSDLKNEWINAQHDVKKLLSEARKLWREWQYLSQPRLKGVIIRMNEGNLSGFILAENGKNLYFSRNDWQNPTVEPRKGLKVEFIVVQRTHPKTQKVVDNAIQVRPIDK